ncbi:hypothetical protein SAMD00024442_21_36 [Candidatus Symbiothrix dinenymphae]|nr:hypothetical protein SAMD00024442_21_36 [Candidatus Symbiothrix dinenymphae]
MNIFKILASGDGSINEPNVSAFLGYLLDTKEDHGIGDELLKQVLECFVNKSSNPNLKNLDFLFDTNNDEIEIRNLSSNPNFNIEVLLEQAFKKEGDKKEIVDIVILCFEKEKQLTESQAKMFLSNDNRGSLKQVFLIENKIRDGSAREEQLTKQCSATISTLAEELNKDADAIKEMLSVIFVSPDAKKANDEYKKFEEDSFTKDIPKIQIHWTSNTDDENTTMIYFLRQILEKESKGGIEAINEQTKFIIKSFINFVDNGFQSAIEEKRVGKKTIRTNYGKPIIDYIKDIYDEWEFDTEYLVADLKSNLMKLVKEKSGEDLDKMTMNCQIYVSIVNEPNRTHYWVSSPSDERKNLFYYVDETQRNKIKKFQSKKAVKDNPNIYWKENGNKNCKKLAELK